MVLDREENGTPKAISPLARTPDVVTMCPNTASMETRPCLFQPCVGAQIAPSRLPSIIQVDQRSQEEPVLQFPRTNNMDELRFLKVIQIKKKGYNKACDQSTL